MPTSSGGVTTDRQIGRGIVSLQCAADASRPTSRAQSIVVCMYYERMRRSFIVLDSMRIIVDKL